MNNLIAKVIVVDKVNNNKEHVIVNNVDINNAERIVTAINQEIKLAGYDDKVAVYASCCRTFNGIELYKEVVDKVLEIVHNDKKVVKVEDFDWDVHDTNKKVKDCIEQCKVDEEKESRRRRLLSKKKMY